jgi:hypothetical protein
VGSDPEETLNNSHLAPSAMSKAEGHSSMTNLVNNEFLTAPALILLAISRFTAPPFC